MHLRTRAGNAPSNIDFTNEFTFGANISYAFFADKFYAGLEFYGAAGTFTPALSLVRQARAKRCRSKKFRSRGFSA